MHKSLVDPLAVLALFNRLSLRPGYILRAYQYVSGSDGNGIVYAMPVDAPFPEPDECPRVDNVFLEPPLPPHADADFMKYIDGDGSAHSYLLASLLARELAEFGAMWHGRSWSDEQILGTAPKSPTPWTWTEEPPTDWRPSVETRDAEKQVTFYTHTIFGQERIVRHTDRYAPGAYVFGNEATVIAHGEVGAVH